MAAAVNTRCMNPSCPWVGQVRVLRPTLIGLGQGVFGMLKLFCECRTELDTEVVAVTEPAITRVP